MVPEKQQVQEGCFGPPLFFLEETKEKFYLFQEKIQLSSLEIHCRTGRKSIRTNLLQLSRIFLLDFLLLTTLAQIPLSYHQAIIPYAFPPESMQWLAFTAFWGGGGHGISFSGLLCDTKLVCMLLLYSFVL